MVRGVIARITPSAGEALEDRRASARFPAGPRASFYRGGMRLVNPLRLGAIAFAAVDDAAALAFWAKDKAPHYGDAAHRHRDWLGIDYAAAVASRADHGGVTVECQCCTQTPAGQRKRFGTEL